MSQVPVHKLPLPGDVDEIDRLRELAELGQISASLLHELRQPIFALQSYLFLLQREGGHAEGLAEQIRYLQSLIEFYDSYTPRSSIPHRVDLRAEIQSVEPVLQRQAQQQRVELRTSFQEQDFCIRSRPAGPRQVVGNLVRNAIEASASTPVALGDSSAESAVVDLGLEREGGWALLFVRDRGPGVPDELAEQIFEPWYTTKGAQGTGLGLHLSRQILRADGGDLAVRSHADGGAIFEARWPLR